MSDERLDFIVPAGGSGSRVGEAIPKQFLPIAPEGRTILSLTLERLLGFGDCGKIVLVCHAGWVEKLPGAVLTPSLYDRLAAIVPGGPTRQASVHNGLVALSEISSNGWVAVHDAARPWVSQKTIRMTWESAKASGAGAVACGPMYDTLKRIGKSGNILRTEDREQYVRTETPQIFRADLLWQASSNALRDGREATDESMLVEPMGYPITAVVSGDPNPKLTTAEDIENARRMLGAK